MAYVEFRVKNGAGDGQSANMRVNAEGSEIAYMGKIAPTDTFANAYTWISAEDYQQFVVVHEGGTQTYLYFTGGEWDGSEEDFVNYVYGLFHKAQVTGERTDVAATYVTQVESILGSDTDITCDAIVPNMGMKLSDLPS